MKFQADTYEIDIRVKRTWDERANKDALLAILNRLCIWGRASEVYHLKCNCPAIANGDAKTVEQLRQIIKEIDPHFYEN